MDRGVNISGQKLYKIPIEQYLHAKGYYFSFLEKMQHQEGHDRQLSGQESQAETTITAWSGTSGDLLNTKVAGYQADKLSSVSLFQKYFFQHHQSHQD